MTDTVSTNSELSTLLWDDLIESVSKSSAEYEVLMKNQAENLRQGVLALFGVFFAKWPQVEAIAWSETREEYDDNTYGGYDFVDMRPAFFKDSIDEETHDYITKNAPDDGFVSSYSWRGTFTPLLTAVLRDVNLLEKAVRSGPLSTNLFGDGGVVATREGIRYFDPDDDILKGNDDNG